MISPVIWRSKMADRFGPIKFDQSDVDVANILLDLANRQTQNVAQRAKVGLVKGVGHEWPLLNKSNPRGELCCTAHAGIFTIHL